MTANLLNPVITSLPLFSRGKVRENYLLGSEHLLMVATDRISAFDVVLNQVVPGKGKMLTQLSAFWLEKLANVFPNHFISRLLPSELTRDECEKVEGRSMIVERLVPVPVEAVVRGYLAGSGWIEYKKTSTVCGIRLPDGLQEGDQLPAPIFTPATKAPAGSHDQNVTFDEMAQQIGHSVALQIRNAALDLYVAGAKIAHDRGIIIADTKFEFGFDTSGRLKLMDEILTPDSSRFWDLETYVAGNKPQNFDKQHIRDWLQGPILDGQPWAKTHPAPMLPSEIIYQTVERYREAVNRITL